MKNVDQLYVSTVDVHSRHFDFSEGYGETWETIVPSVSEFDLEECKAILEEQGVELPDPNPWKMTREELLDELGYDEETEDEEEDVVGTKHEETTDELREELIDKINNEDLDGIDEWREAVENCWNDADPFSPMMNYAYPLPGYHGDEDRDQLTLNEFGLPLCLVRINGDDDEIHLALTGAGMDLSREICLAYMVLGYLPPLHFVSSVPRLGVPEDTERNRWLIEGCVRSAKVAENWAKSAREDIERLRDRMVAKSQGGSNV